MYPSPEAALCGAVLICSHETDQIGRLLNRVKPEDFHNPDYAKIWTIISDFHKRGIPPDMVLLLDALDGNSRIQGVAMKVVNMADPWNAGHYADRVLERSSNTREIEDLDLNDL